ncbi:hypothetical protein E8A74_02190 [Polyangium fumosum]|uniref:Uncharacterized protein n=1 Tax=Polyangium fumosum TaxID=889272 RepID=A0A4U1JIR8_9BACT|nr:hypothetical protein E8A74_02190 [Polyangium fumosum]
MRFRSGRGGDLRRRFGDHVRIDHHGDDQGCGLAEGCAGGGLDLTRPGSLLAPCLQPNPIPPRLVALHLGRDVERRGLRASAAEQSIHLGRDHLGRGTPFRRGPSQAHRALGVRIGGEAERREGGEDQGRGAGPKHGVTQVIEARAGS